MSLAPFAPIPAERVLISRAASRFLEFIGALEEVSEQLKGLCHSSAFLPGAATRPLHVSYRAQGSMLVKALLEPTAKQVQLIVAADDWLYLEQPRCTELWLFRHQAPETVCNAICGAEKTLNQIVDVSDAPELKALNATVLKAVNVRAGCTQALLLTLEADLFPVAINFRAPRTKHHHA